MIREALSFIALCTGWYAAWCALPGDAMAAEFSPWNSPVISVTTAWLILGYLFCAGLAWFIITRIFAIAPRDDDDDILPDPDKQINADEYRRRK